MATCLKCGYEWARDPVVEVPCPVRTCNAGIGKRCTELAPSGHRKAAGFNNLPPWGHDERDLAAAAAGAYAHPCGGHEVKCSCCRTQTHTQPRMEFT